MLSDLLKVVLVTLQVDLHRTLRKAGSMIAIVFHNACGSCSCPVSHVHLSRISQSSICNFSFSVASGPKGTIQCANVTDIYRESTLF